MAIPKRRTALTASITAPIGGWNARDSVAAMPPTDAVSLTNFYPTPTDVVLRSGYTVSSSGITGQVNTLMNYAGTNTQTMFAAAGTSIYNCSTSTASVAYPITNDKLQHVNVSTGGGKYLVACNGTDATMIYDGTKWFSIAPTDQHQNISTHSYSGTTALVTTAVPHGLITGNLITVSGASPSVYNGTFRITVTGASTFTYTMASNPGTDASPKGAYVILFSIPNINSNKFVSVNLFKNRLFFTEKDSLKVWYLPVNSISGTASALDFGGIARNGGFLQGMATWTIDAGQGADDYAVFITNMGEIIVYNGTDPADATTWALKGVWQLGYVFARRCYFKWAGDILLLTQDGLVPLASALQSSRLDPRVNLTDKIFYAISQAADLYSTEFGWQVTYYAKQNMLIINIPKTTGSEQYVMHGISKGWSNFTGINAKCWELQGDDMYFGGNGFVGKFWDTYADDGSQISATCQQAYSYFDTPGQQKRFTLVRPTFFVDVGAPGVYCGINTDFQTQNNLGQVSFQPFNATTAIWGTATWDNDVWAVGSLVASRQWQGVSGIGYSGGINLNMISAGINVHWVSTDYVMEKGSVI